MTYSLPQDFLSRPGPKAVVEKVDFTKTNLPEYKGLYATVIDNALTAEECNALVQAAEAHNDGKWEQALVNVGQGRQMLITDTRDCGRIIWDDKTVVEKIWSRIKDHVPEIQYLKNAPLITGPGPARWNETYQMTRLNERMRFLRYVKGQYFRPHMDGAYPTPDGKEISFFTLHLYLNESDPAAPDGKLEGGATIFHSFNETREFNVVPKIGRVLIFQHKGLYHSGADVEAGVKLTLRTDLMFRKVESGR